MIVREVETRWGSDDLPFSDADLALVGEDLARIRRMGIATKCPPLEELTALDAGVVLGRLLLRYRSALASRELDFTAAVWRLERLQEAAEPEVPAGAGGIARMIIGSVNVQRVLAEVGGSATASRWKMLAEPLPADQSATALQASSLVERGVSLREVYCAVGPLGPEQTRGVRRLTGAGIQVRLVDDAPVNMMIIDWETVVLPLDPDRPSAALVVLRSAALAYLAGLVFHDTWQRAAAPC
ncbi:hypothetical protein V2S66_18595 [Streptomyces sp. V4-01]|uniref:Uncharacterized protein n=1 Tax=Actinacidiphila polyblastidii TaxID=3110430 RepID=A0ABU7PE46_9ACTN|nr:hypothetical protein [Streptomyces sp. V4-01]